MRSSTSIEAGHGLGCLYLRVGSINAVNKGVPVLTDCRSREICHHTVREIDPLKVYRRHFICQYRAIVPHSGIFSCDKEDLVRSSRALITNQQRTLDACF